ncbi:hypothetical protein Alches_21530 [Alicyclobacillus hesperidum subsp. aegles]|uniref:Uncharacterized protein n=1 Tax=Alicyclobacillus hesperidum TaxID=89784 RepID=A0AA37U8P0_9BACL|nr:hypothetical protein [Alicyclobacillus hesperidum]KRW92255.1 hypothetical protein SD51_04180 [Alicyclobacillus tengchongensis]GLG02112.1 hypothetical protein Alches_21530 [Alicyclobacillus hesperidum subsp. aegles]GLV14367.1 hypothetical protein Heshes_20510 [Alicyclobacillus hesperidum]
MAHRSAVDAEHCFLPLFLIFGGLGAARGFSRNGGWAGQPGRAGVVDPPMGGRMTPGYGYPGYMSPYAQNPGYMQQAPNGAMPATRWPFMF